MLNAIVLYSSGRVLRRILPDQVNPGPTIDSTTTLWDRIYSTNPARFWICIAAAVIVIAIVWRATKLGALVAAFGAFFWTWPIVNYFNRGDPSQFPDQELITNSNFNQISDLWQMPQLVWTMFALAAGLATLFVLRDKKFNFLLRLLMGFLVFTGAVALGLIIQGLGGS